MTLCQSPQAGLPLDKFYEVRVLPGPAAESSSIRLTKALAETDEAFLEALQTWRRLCDSDLSEQCCCSCLNCSCPNCPPWAACLQTAQNNVRYAGQTEKNVYECLMMMLSERQEAVVRIGYMCHCANPKYNVM